MSCTHSRSLARRATAVGLGLALALSAAACGSSDSGSGSDVGSGSGAGSAADTTGTFCDAYLKLDQVTAGADTDTTPGAKKTANDIAPEMKVLRSNTPDALTKQVGVLAKGVEAAAGGKAEALQDDGFTKAANESEAWMHAHCGYQSLDLTGVDFKFNDVPTTAKAGKTSIAFKNNTNTGEMHMALVLKSKQGVTSSLDELLALSEDQVKDKADVVGVAFAPPGQTAGALLELTPGTYFLICPLPVGGKDDGPPHFTKGMSATFTVS